jgi:hypothetical protein
MLNPLPVPHLAHHPVPTIVCCCQHSNSAPPVSTRPLYAHSTIHRPTLHAPPVPPPTHTPCAHGTPRVPILASSSVPSPSLLWPSPAGTSALSSSMQLLHVLWSYGMSWQCPWHPWQRCLSPLSQVDASRARTGLAAPIY